MEAHFFHCEQGSLKQMKVVIEKPLPWFNDPREDGRHEFMFHNLKKALLELELDIQEIDYKSRDDFADRVPPENGFYLSYHSVGYKKNVWRIKETPIPHFYSIDKFGHSGWSEISSTSSEYYKHLIKAQKFSPVKGEKIRNSIKDWLITNNLSKYRQSDIVSKLPDRFVFYPLQTNHDPVRVHDRFSQLSALLMAARSAKLHRQHIVVKLHPYCRNKKIRIITTFLKATNKYFHTTTMSLTKILPKCSSVFVANSGAGFEGLIYGKPVFSFSASEYDMAAHRIYYPHQIDYIFTNHHSHHSDVCADSFIDYFINTMCFDSRSIEEIKERIRVIVNIVSTGKCSSQQ